MDKDTLKHIIKWIAEHGIQTYSPNLIAEKFSLPLASVPNSAYKIIEEMLLISINTTQTKTCIGFPQTEDEMFDFMLTFFEELQECKHAFQILFNKTGLLEIEYLNLFSVIKTLLNYFFQKYSKTFADDFTYALFFLKIFYVWLNDETRDLSVTSHEINRFSYLIHSIH